MIAAGLIFLVPPSSVLHSAPLVTIETVTVGNPNNPGDPTTGEGYGAVPYSFEIGKYDVTIAQYTAFLNAVATNTNANPAITSLWIEEMGDSTEDPGSLITRSVNSTNGAFNYSVATNAYWKAKSGNRPVCWVSWFDAARFANWMHNGATNGADTENGAYTLTNYQTEGYVARNTNATWWIPSEDEWYKAAYFDNTKGGDLPSADRYNNFATHTDVLPLHSALNPAGAWSKNAANYNWARYSLRKGPNAGVLTPVGYYSKSKSGYGTFDQCGLVWQWTEGWVSNSTQTNRIVRGGSWGPGLTPVSCYIRRDYPPGFYEDDDTGFRLARKSAAP
jgi:formylglycine-generating enzyme required for sulfatase activity